MRRCGGPILAALFSLAAGPAANVADPLRLVTPTIYGTHLPGLGQPATSLAKRIQKLSAGQLGLDLRQPGQGTETKDILDQVSGGSADAGFSAPSFWAAKIPAAALFSGFPFGPDAKGYVDWFQAGNGRKLYQKMYDQAGYKIHVIPCTFGGGETGGWFAKVIDSKADFEGLRMRIFGLGGRVMARLGAKTVVVPGGAVAAAFEKNQIDAAELYPPSVDQRQNLQGKVKLIYVPGWHQPETVLELLINKDRWNTLDDQQQALIETACEAMLLETLAESGRAQKKALADFARDGVRIAPWPDEVLTAFREAWAEVAQEESGKDPFFKEVLDDLTQFGKGEAGALPQASVGGGEP
ncbi:MAG: TRAP transporter substrate-binding protein [Methyloceanibacter sp.]|uniref:TRAP transporter substrate-binding protein n=1 Tax=Methyloceanibacter sp. TaxID=1965321 RepID=UPI003D9BC5BB